MNGNLAVMLSAATNAKRSPEIGDLSLKVCWLRVTRRSGHAHDDYQRAVHDELESSLSALLVADLKRYFECRRGIQMAGDPQADEVFRSGHPRFSTPRFEDLHRRWIKHGDEAFNSPSSVAITEALESGAGGVESIVLPHSYRHLSPPGRPVAFDRGRS